MELRLQKGSIKATRQIVNDILGIPMGNTKLQDLDKIPDNDLFIAEWEAQYNHLGKPTPRIIALQMSCTTKADFMFKINFLSLFGSTMGTLKNGGRVPKKLVKCIKEETDISDIDWCGYILDCLHDNSSMDEYSESKSDVDNNNNKKNDYEEEKEKNYISKGTKEAGREQKEDEEDDQDDPNNEHEFEKLTRDDREVAFSMEVDETENEKEKQTENVKEQQAEKEKEKQDDIGKGTKEIKDKEADKQKVNDRNENEKDKQDEHNHLTQDEFWNKEYDLTDSQCEELEYQATQYIKKKKTTKRKSPEDMTPLTFSLGLTPEEYEPTQKEKDKQVEKKQKKTAIKGKTTTDKVMMTEYLFSMKGKEFEFVYETKDGAATIREYMQTLALQLKVESNVIDTFSLILNHEQKMNSKGKKTKYFFHTTMIILDSKGAIPSKTTVDAKVAIQEIAE
ncbi:hypothetical protein Tco_0511536 [Tanacetum coccineum]